MSKEIFTTAIDSIKAQQRVLAIQGLSAATLMAGVVYMLLDWQGATLTTGVTLALVGLVIVVAVSMSLIITIPHYVEGKAKQALEAIDTPQIDPWQMQRALMVASGQQTPATPRFTNGTVLYGALILEEGGETLAEIVKALKDYRDSDAYQNEPDTQVRNWIRYHINLFDYISTQMGETSVTIRKLLTGITYDFEMTPERTVAMLDGTTDLAVVNCGFALATGLPGADAYEEVVSSNLSKRNPRTGMIDKTPDGKWIKGPDYQAPDLAKVLAIKTTNS